MSVHWPIMRRCLASPFRVGMVDDRRTYRGIDLLVGAAHLAGQLGGVNKTGTLGVMVPTSGAFAMAALAGWMLGRVVVPLNYLLKREELQYVIDDCGTDTLVSAGALLDHLGYEPRVPALVRLEEVSFKGVPDPVWPAWASDEDLAVLLYTSGTSGKPKGVMLTHGNLCANARQVRDWASFTREDVMLGVLPQFHSFGLTVLTLLPLTFGIKVVYSARFVPTQIMRLIRAHRPTIFVGIPSMYNALLTVKDATRADFASLRYAVSGGEPLPDTVFARFRERFGVTINEGYGLTETGPVTNWCRPEEWRPHSVGRALPGVVERIVDPNTGEEVGPNAEGEVRICGPNLMKGYYGLEEETARAIGEDGFLRTGDIGKLDEDGHLYITGRIKEMLIIGGENVFPREIEEVLNAHPSVKESGVVGVADPMRGERPAAFVELHEGELLDQTALQMWCRARLAGYKVPDSIRAVEVMPRNATGKILRRELKKLI